MLLRKNKEAVIDTMSCTLYMDYENGIVSLLDKECDKMWHINLNSKMINGMLTMKIPKKA